MSRIGRKLKKKERVLAMRLEEERNKIAEKIEYENKKISDKIENDLNVCAGIAIALLRL